MSFTGFTLAELQLLSALVGAGALLKQLDILIDGAYVESLVINSPESLVSSRNQRIHIFNEAYQDEITSASDPMEIHILKDGTRMITGFPGQWGLE